MADNFARTRPSHNFLDDGVLGFHAHCRACQERAQFRGLRISRTKIVKLLASRLGSALCERYVRHRIGVLEARGLQCGLPSRLFTKLLISDSCAVRVNCLARSVSAPSTARFAASAFRSRRPPPSLASLSPFPAPPTFFTSLSLP